jgi:hypothetical protein
MRNPQTADKESAQDNDRDRVPESRQPSDYYYDDSTGYEVYEEDNADEEDEAGLSDES